MLPVVVYGADGGAVVAALVGAAAALIVALLGGLLTYRATVRQAKAVVEAAKGNARALLEAAVEQAAGVREAGFSNAIETEAMKLRFQVAERHLDRFHCGASKLMAALRDVAQTAGQAAEGYVQLMAHSPYDPLVEAELVVRPEDWDRLSGARLALAQACESVRYVVVGGKGYVPPESELPAVWTPERYAELGRSCETAVEALQHIIAVVGVSTIVRAQGVASDEALALLSNLCLRWEKRKALLKKIGMWGGRFVGDD